jgi:hypothetical protein
VVESAAGEYRIFFQCPETGGGFSGADHPCRVGRDNFNYFPCLGSDTGEMRQEIQGRSFSCENGSCVPPDDRNRIAGFHVRSVLFANFKKQAGIQSMECKFRDVYTGDAARGTDDDFSRRCVLGGNDGSGCNIAGPSKVFPQGPVYGIFIKNREQMGNPFGIVLHVYPMRNTTSLKIQEVEIALKTCKFF